MSTVVFFHAHPDDEAIASAGTMAGLAAEGHRVVLVTATRGELGEYPPDVLDEGETLAERRAVELAEACRILGVARAAAQLRYAEEPGWAQTPQSRRISIFQYMPRTGRNQMLCRRNKR